MKPSQVAAVILSSKIINSGTTVGHTKIAPTAYVWVELDLGGKIIKISGALTPDPVKRRILKSVYSGATMRSDAVKSALKTVMARITVERDAVLSRDKDVLSAQMGRAVITREERIRRREQARAVEQVRSLLRTTLSGIGEEEWSAIWRDSQVENVLQS